VTSEAILVGHSLRVEHLSYFVRLVTIHAGRKNVRLFFPQFAFDDLSVDQLNFRVTLRARCSDVFPCNRRPAVRVRQDRVRRMARDTTWRDNEPFTQQPFTMNTFREVLQNVILMDCSLTRYGRAFLVALAAEEGDVQRHNRRSTVGGWQNLVRSVTVFASRCQWITAGNRLPVKRFYVKLFFLVVTGPAIDGLKFLCVGEFLPFEVLVTRYTRQRRMSRRRKFLFVNEHRNGLPRARSREGLVTVTRKAVAVFLRNCV
jgi:hypothetical protein